MESNVVCELFKRAPARGIKDNKYSGDSTTLLTIKQMFPMVLKKILILFTQSSLSTRLYNLSQCQKF